MRRLSSAGLLLVAVSLAACSSGAAPGWTYAPAPSATPAPSGSAAPSASASASPSTAPSSAVRPSASASGSGGAVILTITAPVGAATAGFDPAELEGPANTPFTVVFDNQDTTTGPHNWTLKDSTGAKIDIGDTSFFTAPAKREYKIPALAAGDYPFTCEVHPAVMTGTLTVK
jgi:plastocyanin